MVKGRLCATAETMQKTTNNADSFLAVFISGNDTAEMGESGHRIIGSSGKSRLGDLQRLKDQPEIFEIYRRERSARRDQNINHKGHEGSQGISANKNIRDDMLSYRRSEMVACVILYMNL